MPKLGMCALFFAIDAEQASAKFSIQESKYRMRIKMRGSFMSSRAFTLGLDPYIVTMAGSRIAASVCCFSQVDARRDQFRISGPMRKESSARMSFQIK